MNFEGLIPVIQCQRIEQTLAFYQQALRYIIIDQSSDSQGLNWVHLKSDNTHLMLQKHSENATILQNSGNIVLYYYTCDVTAQHHFMTAKGFKVGQIETTPYHMKQFFTQDPEGNRIAVGQDAK